LWRCYTNGNKIGTRIPRAILVRVTSIVSRHDWGYNKPFLRIVGGRGSISSFIQFPNKLRRSKKSCVSLWVRLVNNATVWQKSISGKTKSSFLSSLLCCYMLLPIYIYTWFVYFFLLKSVDLKVRFVEFVTGYLPFLIELKFNSLNSFLHVCILYRREAFAFSPSVRWADILVSALPNVLAGNTTVFPTRAGFEAQTSTVPFHGRLRLQYYRGLNLVSAVCHTLL